ncbi:MAG: mRNA surveillance protein pelota [archaeon]
MQVLSKNYRKGDVKVKITNLDDLWYLSHIIEPEDKVSGKTFRKIKIGGEDERKAKIVKKPVHLSINVEKIEFHKFSNSLRVSGKVVEGAEEIPKGSYHTFDLNEGVRITISKLKWLNYQVEKLEDSAKEKKSNVLICVFDRDSASFALLKQYGFEIINEFSGDVERKGDESSHKISEFYSEVAKLLEDYVKRYEIENIIIGSPAFWKDEFMKVLKKKSSQLSSKITLVTCNTTGQNGINEVLKRDEIKTVLKQDRVVQEIAMVEELLAEISKDNLAVYGFKETKSAVDAGAVKSLLVTDKLITEFRDKEQFAKLDSLMKNVDSMKGNVHIISIDHDGGKKLDGIGGIGAILRYKLN